MFNNSISNTIHGISCIRIINVSEVLILLEILLLLLLILAPRLIVLIRSRSNITIINTISVTTSNHTMKALSSLIMVPLLLNTNTMRILSE
jgi:hypothetical protein